MKTRRILLAGSILAAVAGVIVFVFSTVPAVPAPSSTDPPPITWTPKKIASYAFSGGTARSMNVSFTSSENFQNVVVRVVPELQPYVRVEPTTFASIRRGEPLGLTLTFAPAANTPLGDNGVSH